MAFKWFISDARTGNGALRCFASTSGRHTSQSANSMVNPDYLALQSLWFGFLLCDLWR